MVCIWYLWYARNVKYHEGGNTSAMELVTFVRVHYQEFEEANKRHHPLPSNGDECWNPPPPSSVKVNFDASFAQNLESGWSGVIIWNNGGQVMGASRRVIRRVTSTFAAEATTAIHVMDLALDLGFNSIVVEGDSRAVITKLSSVEEDASKISAVIYEGKQLTQNLHACRF
ncbi:uncharacterized protein LOC120191160 [Hibiscus syriacus]|uniref:uncharacterized protein LOC120121092 n=1 Tax=Hibiscus syriacus TaxID=106335 RepID=UPI001923EAB0|nr:uncharacterized protein LOC120121092 [Hibiscus syriacus]XP_039050068.1 uncharacterized protein LOC120191160 [Hibiscus syriacus]